MDQLKHISSSPHVRDKASTGSLMFIVIIALLPAAGFGIYNFGMNAAIILAVSVMTCVLSELLYDLLMHKPITIKDCSCIVTGLLLGMNLSPNVPWWIPVIGGVFAIIVVKMLFGGLGQNVVNPALAGRCFLLISFAGRMTDFTYDAVSGATPLASLKAGEAVDTWKMVTGFTAGCIGETSLIAICIGAIVLLLFGVIDLRIPGTYIVTFALFVLIFGGHGLDANFLIAQLAGGGLMLGAWFMATDYVTSPITKNGQYLYGIFLGLMTGIFRILGNASEGVSYAILLGNLLVPLMEKVTLPTPFGTGGKKA